ncbi:MAG: hypothetical protein PHY91_06415 [Tissierellia bacterium]|nr:hypothetical protein [Tissierellia bacterium]MDD4726534.1 hypothetical protein [Tissierellia bacterium]
MRNQYLYIVLTRTNTVMSRLIQIIKNDSYTHASISLDSNLHHMYSFGRKYTFNPFLGRFKKEDIDEGIYKLSRTVPCVIMEVQVSEQQYERVKELLEQFISNRNIYKYNYIGLLHNLIKKSVCYDYRFLCSEFVYHILNESGIVEFNKSRNLVSPENLLDIEGKIVYQGDLKHMDLLYRAQEIEEIKLKELNAIKELSAIYE